MEKYAIEITQIVKSFWFECEADNEQEAVKKAWDAHSDGDIEYDEDTVKNIYRVANVYDKAAFLQLWLPALEIAVSGIESIRYELRDDLEEFAVIKCGNGYVKKVCISGDSYLGIMKDILKQINI